MADFIISKLVIVGVGLIGGSFAAALREAGAVKHIVGVGRTRKSLEVALKAGLIDEIAADPASALHGADFVLLATPVGQMAQMMMKIAPHLPVDAVITDAGSTKQDVVAVAREHLARHLAHFVPAHPIAGAERSGAAAAKADLFRGKNLIVTPLRETAASALDRVCAAWRVCGAQLGIMKADEHDAIFAAVSHLPHVLSFALVDMLAQRWNAEQLFSMAAGGFRDFTRIAGSSPEMWRDICLANRDSLLREMQHYQTELDRLMALIKSDDAKGLLATFANAREVRRRWLEMGAAPVAGE